jgi:hypothetical protein
MIDVIFEAVPASGRKQHYLDLVATLGTQLSRIDGFVSVERFQSLADPGKMLPLSFFATKRRYASGGTPPPIARRSGAAGAASSQTIACGSLRWCGTMACSTAPRRRRIAAAKRSVLSSGAMPDAGHAAAVCVLRSGGDLA